MTQLIETAQGGIEDVTASFTAAVADSAQVQLAVGSQTQPFAVGDGSTWLTPHAVAVDGDTVTASLRIGVGHVSPAAGMYWLWYRAVTPDGQVLLHPARAADPFMVTDRSGGAVAARGPFVESVTGTAVDNTDPLNPVINSTGGEGGGAVASVFGRTGTVTAQAGDYSAFYDTAGAAASALASALAASQPVDSDLTAIAALATTAFGRGLLTLIDATALRTAAGLGTAATQASTAFDPAGAATAAQTAAITSANGYTDTAVAGEATARNNAITAAVNNLVNSAPGTLDTLGEIAAQLASDESAVAALTTTVAGKLAKSANLSDLANPATARTNLGLGSAATQASTAFDAAGAAAAAQAASQPLDSDLTAIAALTTTAFGRSFLTLADAAAARALLGLATVAATGAYSDLTGKPTLGTAAAADTTAFDAAGAASAAQAASLQKASNLSDLASASTARTNLGLGTAATANKVGAGSAGVLDATDPSTTNARTPTAHAATHAAAGSDPITITESQVTGLTTDLAAKASTSYVDTGDALALKKASNLSDLASASTARTNLGLGSLATVTPTGTPDGTKFLRDDGSWAAAAGGSGTSYGLSIFGDGSDGSPTFDGTTTVLGMAPSGSVYTLARDLFLASPTVNSGVQIKTNGFRLFASGTLTNNGTIHWNGNNGSGATAGLILTNSSSTLASSIGGGTAGGAGGTTNGTAGTSNTTRAWGGAGAAGGAGAGGSGGAAGTVTAPSTSLGVPRFAPLALLGHGDQAAFFSASAFSGGAGGGGGGGDGTNPGGGGGSGGGILVLSARIISGTGLITTRGGNGGNAPTGNAGGGGGGGGGWVIVLSGSVSGGAITGQTIDANGGTGGAKAGTGVAGGNGSNGNVVVLAA